MAKLSDEMVDVSHGWGVPLGGIGTGYSLFGKYGFVRVNFDSTPDRYSYARDPASREDYTKEVGAPRKAKFGFALKEDLSIRGHGPVNSSRQWAITTDDSTTCCSRAENRHCTTGRKELPLALRK